MAFCSRRSPGLRFFSDPVTTQVMRNDITLDRISTGPYRTVYRYVCSNGRSQNRAAVCSQATTHYICSQCAWWNRQRKKTCIGHDYIIQRSMSLDCLVSTEETAPFIKVSTSSDSIFYRIFISHLLRVSDTSFFFSIAHVNIDDMDVLTSRQLSYPSSSSSSI